MKLCVIGTGYVGLVTAVCLASKGHSLICVDKDVNKLESLKKGKCPIYENGLQELLTDVIQKNLISFTSDLNSALDEVDIVLVAVGTPSKQDGSIDLKYIELVIDELGLYISQSSKFISIVIKSTVIPSTTDTHARERLETISGKKFKQGFGLGMNPEFLREGCAVSDFLSPDRIILGSDDIRTENLLHEVYKDWEVDKLSVTSRTAEFIKYANNAMLATLISSINQLSNLSSKIGNIDFNYVEKGIHLDGRWNPILNGQKVNPSILSYLRCGCGYGGSCFPKDVAALCALAESYGEKLSVFNSVLDVNRLQPHVVSNRLRKETSYSKESKVLVLGLSFKPDTDDLRESPAYTIVEDLVRYGSSTIYVHDPKSTTQFIASSSVSTHLSPVLDWRKVISQMDIIIIITLWKEYLEIPNLLKSGQVFFDTRNNFDLSSINHCSVQHLQMGTRMSH